jgi:hypothetical protein
MCLDFNLSDNMPFETDSFPSPYMFSLDTVFMKKRLMRAKTLMLAVCLTRQRQMGQLVGFKFGSEVPGRTGSLYYSIYKK